MALELTLEYFTPIIAFLLVFTLVYAVLTKTKLLGENASIHAFLSFLIAIIFILTPAARLYTFTFTPWLVVFLVSVFLCLLVLGFVQGNIESLVKNKFVSAGIIIVLLMIFLISGVHVFSSVFEKYLGYANLSFAQLRDIILHPALLSVVALFIIAAALSFWFKKK